MDHKYHLRDVREQLERGSLALFIGADLPREITGLPSRADLARKLAHRRGLDESWSLAQVAQHFILGGSKFSYTRVLLDELSNARPQPFHQQVIELVKNHNIKTIITTAYDDLLDRAFDKAEMGFNRVVRGTDVNLIQIDRPSLIKLYGDIRDVETLVVTQSDHTRLLRDVDRKPVVDYAQNVLRLNTVLFIGYNLDDPDFQFMFDEVAESDFAQAAYAVWPELPEGGDHAWQEQGITILDVHPLQILNAIQEQETSLTDPEPQPQPEPGDTEPPTPSSTASSTLQELPGQQKELEQPPLSTQSRPQEPSGISPPTLSEQVSGFLRQYLIGQFLLLLLPFLGVVGTLTDVFDVSLYLRLLTMAALTALGGGAILVRSLLSHHRAQHRAWDRWTTFSLLVALLCVLGRFAYLEAVPPKLAPLTSAPSSFPTPTVTPTCPMPAFCQTQRECNCLVETPSPTGYGQDVSCEEVVTVSSPTTVAGIRIDMMQRAEKGYGYSLWEAKIYGPDGTDLTRIDGVNIETSSQERGSETPGPFCCSARYAIDDKLWTRWGSAHCCESRACPELADGRLQCDNEEGKDPQWIEITLAEPARVDRVVLIWEKAYAVEYCIAVIPVS